MLIAGTITTVALVAAGGVLVGLGLRERSQNQVALAPYFGGDSAGLVFSGRF